MILQELVTVYTLADPMKAGMIRNALVEEGIECLLEGADQAVELGPWAGDIKVVVQSIDAERARTMIEEHERAETTENDSEEGL